MDSLQGLVELKDTIPRCSSQVIADRFGRRHSNVAGTIEKLKQSLKVIHPEDNWDERFLKIPGNYRGQSFDVYWLDREAFSLLAMRFITPAALKWQVNFVKAFFELEKQAASQFGERDKQWLKQRQQGKLLRRQETDAIKILVDYATEQGSKHAHFYYKNITSMTYRCLGFVKQAGSESLRDTLDVVQHIQLASAEIVASRAILRGVQDKRHYKEIYLLAEQAVMANIRSFMPEFDRQPKQLTEGK